MTLVPLPKRMRESQGAAWALAAAGLGALALYNYRRSRRAEARNPPRGQWVSADGVLLHYLVAGEGPVVALIHGNQALSEDFVASGLFERLAESRRVYVFDRPGYGYSDRPGRLYMPWDDARLLRKALEALGVRKVTAVGHSYGALVAMALALDHPGFVERLAVIGGYFYASPRLDVLLAAPPILPLVGDLMRHTIAPVLMRLLQPAIFRMIFAPGEPPERFLRGFPSELAARPSQIRAQTEDAAAMVPAAARMQGRYRSLSLPVTIIAGADDRWVDPRAQSQRLHRDIRGSRCEVLPGVGHMAHYQALPRILALLEAPDQALWREPAPTTGVGSSTVSAARSGAAPGG